MYLSDDHPISITLEFTDTNTRFSFWHLDPSLLTDPAILSLIHQELRHYFTENYTPEISPMTRREAHKCVIWGELIAQVAKRRQERQACIDNLITRIHTLEQAHKMSQAALSLRELQQTRTDLLEELN